MIDDDDAEANLRCLATGAKFKNERNLGLLDDEVGCVRTEGVVQRNAHHGLCDRAKSSDQPPDQSYRFLIYRKLTTVISLGAVLGVDAEVRLIARLFAERPNERRAKVIRVRVHL